MESTKDTRHIRARVLYLLKPGSQFLGDNCNDDDYVAISRIMHTGRLRRFPPEQILNVMNGLVYSENILEYDTAILQIRYARNSPLIVAALVLE